MYKTNDPTNSFFFPFLFSPNLSLGGDGSRLDYDYYDGEGDVGSPLSSDYYQHSYHHQYYSPPTSPPPPNCTVIATVRGWLTHDRGGRLESVETGVALLVPPGALPPVPESHLVYFKVCRQESRPTAEALYSNGPPVDQGKGIKERNAW